MAMLGKKFATVLVLLCLWALLVHQQKACGFTSVPLLLGIQEKKPRMLAEMNVASLHKRDYRAMAPSSVDPNRMSDRRVRRGSDPILYITGADAKQIEGVRFVR
ncbi:hypothetical protein PR202_gb03081 [Eleusine coracana subsp. coracana]|uniref:Uncharacterized protein n=1 Tax=Eleusine coracana subsp. coracana TaxID=191504 RepID=A0AAV5DYJ8_ELECO|nr:hypothetical protein PR202_gb03081 [Eleusine coracana subsp. coracana]